MSWLVLAASVGATEVVDDAAAPAVHPVEQALIAYATAECDALEVDVRWLGLADAAQVPPGEILWEGDVCKRAPVLRLVVVQDAAVVQRVTVKPSLDITVSVPVAVDAAQRDGVLTTEPGLVLLHNVDGRPVQGPVLATRTVQAGDPVTDRNSRAVPDLRTGSAVTLVAQSGSLTVRADGVALQDASVGDTVRVRNLATDRVLDGELTDSGTVLLR